MTDDAHLDAFGPLVARSRRRTFVMWAAIALCLAVVAALLLAGLGDSAWSIGALLLIVSCFAACGWAGITSQHDIDQVVEEAKRLVAERQAAEDARRAAWAERQPASGPNLGEAEGGSP